VPEQSGHLEARTSKLMAFNHFTRACAGKRLSRCRWRSRAMAIGSLRFETQTDTSWSSVSSSN